MVLEFIKKYIFIGGVFVSLMGGGISCGWGGAEYLYFGGGSWTVAANWGLIPDATQATKYPGLNDTAIFAYLGVTPQTVSNGTSVGKITFQPGFSVTSYTINFQPGVAIGSPGEAAIQNTIAAAQTLNFTGNNSFYGGATVSSPSTIAMNLSSGNSIWYADGSPSISADIQITNPGDTLTVATVSQADWSYISNFNGVISGNGGVNIGEGTTGVLAQFNEVNTYGGPTSINNGILLAASANIPTNVVLSNSGEVSFQDTGTALFAKDISGNGIIQLEQNGTLTLSHPITGYISVFNNGGGTLIFTNTSNNYNGPNSVIENNSTFQGTSQTISSAAPISYGGAGGTLRFKDSSGGTPTWAGIITDHSGGGAPLIVEHNGTATLTLSQPLTGNIGVNVSNGNGTLVLSSPANYTGSTTLIGNMQFTTSGISSLSGPVTGNGILTISGGGKLFLGSSDNQISRQIIVNNSTLALGQAGALGGASPVMNGGVFDLSPIDLSGGSQTVIPGDLTIPSLSTVQLGINKTNSTILNINSVSNLNLSNISLIVLNTSSTALYGPSQEVTLFSNTANASNNFNQVTLVGLDAFTGILDTSTPGAIKYIVQKKSDGNIQTAANTSIVTGHTAFKMAQVLTTTLNTQRQSMRNEGATFGGFSSFQGNPIKAPDVDVSYLSLTDGGLDRAVEENMKCWNPLGRKKTSIWAQPFGIILDQGTVNGVPGFSSRTGGILFGMDHKVNSRLLVGGGLGYAYTKMSLEQNLGKSRVKDKFATVFSSFFGDAWHVDLALVGGFQHHRGYRTVEGTNLTVESQHNGYQIMPHIGGGVTFGMSDCYQVHTFAQFDYVYSHENRYQENGANILNYFIEAHDSSMLRSEVGFHIAQICDLETAQWLRSVKLSLINKAPLKKGPIVSSYGDSAQSTNLNTTFISPGVKSTLQYADGFSVGFNYNAEISFTNKTTSQELILQAGKKF